MSGIVLSASVRQNLLSLQSTADLLSTTQNRLATGKKVNTALDNPTNFFTAASLDNRAGDINNLLDGIGNGVQVLQVPVGYSTKASQTSLANAGGTAANLLGGALAQGDVLTIAATGGGTASNITFGTGAAEVDTLAELNAALAANNLQASVDDTTGKITITTTNDAASATIGAFAGTATAGVKAFSTLTTVAKVADAASQATRANLVAQYTNIIAQITTTAQDSSYNGVNLLNGDNLKLTFNETGKSTLNISGVTFNAAGLGLSSLVAGTDFLDSSSANKAITALGTASSSLRSQASSLGSNLSIVQIRQDFSKNLINVLQTGSANLTLADTNEEAANSQALSTRQSIAVSALALANQSQQSVLQLLR